MHEEILYAGRTAANDDTRAVILSILASRLGGELRREAILRAYACSQTLGDHGAQSAALFSLVKAASAAPSNADWNDLRREVIEDALRKARAVTSPYDRAKALAVGVSHLPARRRYEIALEALQASGKISSENCAPYVPDQRKGEVLEMLALSAPQRILALLVRAVRSNEESLWRCRVIIAVLPRLRCSAGERLAREARQWAQSLSPAANAPIFASLAPYLSRAERSNLFDQAMATAEGIIQPGMRLCTLGALLPHLPHSKRAVIGTTILNDMQSIEDAGMRCDALCWIVAHGQKPQRGTAAEAALDIATRVADPMKQSSMLAYLVARVPPQLRSDATRMFTKSVRCLASPSERAFALGSLKQGMPVSCWIQLLPVVQETLRLLGEQPRPVTLQAIAELLPVMISNKKDVWTRLAPHVREPLLWWP
jgi:hypothetical protein